ncbi:hypothetical protein CesoFtcFv8_007020 [Champsocephalus esox]|nr:hypothetical protein CesoFtcFv8_007020 [Champsocephalus esox]KAK5927450.1 hypothetical protein CgunFtcFv8_012606 [Champsocephalus gunnari]
MSAESSSSLPESELCFLASVQTKAWRLWRASCPGLTRPRSGSGGAWLCPPWTSIATEQRREKELCV